MGCPIAQFAPTWPQIARSRGRDEQSHTTFHCNCMPRLKPLACERQSEEEWSAVVCLLCCVGVPFLVSLCPLVSEQSKICVLFMNTTKINLICGYFSLRRYDVFVVINCEVALCVLFFLAALITVRAKLTVNMVRRSVFFPVRYHTIGSRWPL